MLRHLFRRSLSNHAKWSLEATKRLLNSATNRLIVVAFDMVIQWIVHIGLTFRISQAATSHLFKSRIFENDETQLIAEFICRSLCVIIESDTPMRCSDDGNCASKAHDWNLDKEEIVVRPALHLFLELEVLFAFCVGVGTKSTQYWLVLPESQAAGMIDVEQNASMA